MSHQRIKKNVRSEAIADPHLKSAPQPICDHTDRNSERPGSSRRCTSDGRPETASTPSMATQYTAEQFVESAGAILFKLSTRQICLVHRLSTGEWLLPKGRRNVGESRAEAAIREAAEETGFQCRLLPLTMTTRAPPAKETANCRDKPRVHHGVCEPFKVTCRPLSGVANLKIIWWYIGAIDEEVSPGAGETQFEVRLFGFEEVEGQLTFSTDWDVVRKAIQIFDAIHAT
ncbi:hypothetical protein LTR91_007966 [Friedmanniomyces endolithicus]|uniref:Nudix hydrolase domain-containing protein n=1 Tax=Friedmanniomyces endolithicus TaxID=329885 RepID=A0AAN6KQJ9_9PEZI|nr:hypothetical protein LTR91_007966 [Friedmanniomyces endolithicus]